MQRIAQHGRGIGVLDFWSMKVGDSEFRQRPEPRGKIAGWQEGAGQVQRVVGHIGLPDSEDVDFTRFSSIFDQAWAWNAGRTNSNSPSAGENLQ